jgi:carbonic anhydrase
MNRQVRTITLSLSNAKWDLGFRQIPLRFRELFSKKYIREDLFAGITVACVAVPLSLAIALASGVKPEVGLATAIVASIVAAIFGGTPLAVSGPAAAMSVLIASVVSRFGITGLLIVGLLCGCLQLIAGVFRLGNYIRFVPMPVVAGFTAGIGATIFLGQYPRALGLMAPDPSHVCDVVTHAFELISQTNPSALILALTTIGIGFLVPRLSKKLPAALLAVLLPTIAAEIFSLNAPRLGTLPSSLPLPHFPSVTFGEVNLLFGTAVTVFVLASLETLLSSSAVDKLAKAHHDPDQELIGQGIANIFTSLFGGIPVTGVIARSALNVQAGARTRRAAIIHALVLVASVYLFSAAMGRIPIAVLSGLLLMVALRMMHPRELVTLWKTSRSEAFLYLITFSVIVMTDLVVGIEVGLISAFIIASLRMGQTHIQIHCQTGLGPTRIGFSGHLTFLSSAKFADLMTRLNKEEHGSAVIFDLSDVSSIDASGAEQLVEIMNETKKSGKKAILFGVPANSESVLKSADPKGEVTHSMPSTEVELDTQLAGSEKNSALNRLLYGVDRYRAKHQAGLQPLFNKLKEGQTPHTLVITCADSRIDPTLITSSNPGELLVVRNIGNIVPPFEQACGNDEGAAIEYAVGILGVKEIIVCGHSGCGAITALYTGAVPTHLRSLERWLGDSCGATLSVIRQCANIDEAAKVSGLQQVNNLLSYPIVRDQVVKGDLRVHAWFFEVSQGEVEAWDDFQGEFVPVGKNLETPCPATVVA